MAQTPPRLIRPGTKNPKLFNLEPTKPKPTGDPPAPKPESRQPRRLGRFAIPQDLLSGNQTTALAIYRDMVVLRAEANFVTEELWVWAESVHFDFLKTGDQVPEYRATLVAPKGLAPRTHLDIVVQWERKK